MLKSPDEDWQQMPEIRKIRMDINAKASEEVSYLRKRIKRKVFEIIQPELSAFKKRINSASLQDLQNPDLLLLKFSDIQSERILEGGERINPPISLSSGLQNIYKDFNRYDIRTRTHSRI